MYLIPKNLIMLYDFFTKVFINLQFYIIVSSMNDTDKKRRQIKSYVIRKARITSRQKKAYNEYYNDYCIDVKAEHLNYNDHFTRKDIVVEIGFGTGEATIEIAKNNPDTGYIAIDVHTPGVGKLLADIKDNELTNIKVIEGDAVAVFNHMIADESLKGIHIFFPDPWPKKKHHKRRLIKHEFMTLISKKVRPGGYVYVVTDWENYAMQIIEVMNGVDSLENKYNGFADPIPWRPGTKFERKGLEKQHSIWELYYTKK